MIIPNLQMRTPRHLSVNDLLRSHSVQGVALRRTAALPYSTIYSKKARLLLHRRRVDSINTSPVLHVQTPHQVWKTRLVVDVRRACGGNGGRAGSGGSLVLALSEFNVT